MAKHGLDEVDDFEDVSGVTRASLVYASSPLLCSLPTTMRPHDYVPHAKAFSNNTSRAYAAVLGLYCGIGACTCTRSLEYFSSLYSANFLRDKIFTDRPFANFHGNKFQIEDSG